MNVCMYNMYNINKPHINNIKILTMVMRRYFNIITMQKVCTFIVSNTYIFISAQDFI